MADKIEVGDVVYVALDAVGDCSLDKATVLYIPQASGDAWHFRTSTGYLVYVQQYYAIYLKEEK